MMESGTGGADAISHGGSVGVDGADRKPGGRQRRERRGRRGNGRTRGGGRGGGGGGWQKPGRPAATRARGKRGQWETRGGRVGGEELSTKSAESLGRDAKPSCHHAAPARNGDQ